MMLIKAGLLLGYNCTTFAYRQTGTGKTYTMAGEMTEEFGLLSDNAGIIPRTLYTLFDKLKGRDSTVKCSFIELERNGVVNGNLLVKGMQESYIDSPSAGLQLLTMGSQKRQVAATKCNDLSSRSHTVFTIHVLTKTSEVSFTSGKLNLVDLAGSENIQRSGSEKKRAVEAGQINKSFLTLGRVINVLVDKSSHVPYRESKLTRLLQDSLGGRTKTCIIATVSPCLSNQEETISTLDYAFRAKNIHNRPQMNTPVPKDALLSELASEVENLKRNLIATRHRNGVYMTSDAHEEMTKENESQRIINQEQKQRIEALESNLNHKAEESLALKRQLQELLVDNKEAPVEIGRMKDTLHKAEQTWDISVAGVSDFTEKLQTRMKSFQAQQTGLLRDFSNNLSQFLENEMMAAQKNSSILHDVLLSVENMGMRSKAQTLKDQTEAGLEDLKEISQKVRAMVGTTMNEVSQAIRRVTEGLQDALLKCSNDFEMAYTTLQTEIESTFETIIRHPEEQSIQTSELQLQLQDANSRMKEMNHKTSIDVARLLEEERTSAEAERRNFLDQIAALYDLSLQTRWNRLQGNYSTICNDISSSGDLMEGLATHSRVDECITKQKQIAEEIIHLRSQLKVRMEQDKKTINNEHLSARRAVLSAQKDLQQTVENGEDGFDEPVALWAQKLENTQSHNNKLIDAYLNKSNTLEATVQQSCSMVKGQRETVLQSCGKFQEDMLLRSDSIEQPIATLEKDICEPLSHLQESIRNPIFLISACLKRPPESTNTSPQDVNMASLTCSVHEGPQEKNFHDRQQLTDSDRGGIPPWIPDNPVEQPCSEVPSDNDEPRIKRRRI
ncbi:kinesin-domain-containing protein [Aspergillus pseudonomiae]|uniref:Kinesin-like protein n=1 Tax=Aspergillus pseudonomiae TaxID=1506151 RepID=A0A5N7D904_9EURO|nr:kinesin-domain-containing protein [Aspergillus pseudonomiae]KAE8402932.1 kinesin-domain-containing protein [Aspergillus pseudonomiae]